MILATYRTPDGRTEIGVVDRARACITSLGAERNGRPADPAFADMTALMAAGVEGLARAAECARAPDATRYPVEAVRLLAPVPVPAQIRDFSVFAGHIRDAPRAGARLLGRLGRSPGILPPTGADIPVVYREQPIHYLSNRFSVVGDGALVRWPRACRYFDYECEVGVFIGVAGRDITPSNAMAHVFGFAIFNDFSARDLQLIEMAGWLGPAKGKGFDTGNAIGPWIVTPDEMPDFATLTAEIAVNGEIWARCGTGGMLHDFPAIIAQASRDETLQVGEFLASGTFPGGSGLEIDRFLPPDAEVAVTIEPIGTLRNRVLRDHHPSEAGN